jgi:adenylylsulfate kinase-like enzyme
VFSKDVKALAKTMADLGADGSILYARARKGEIEQMTGISSPYEAPETPEIRVETVGREVADVVREIRRVIDKVVRPGGATHQ